jgi:MoxR-like ATPase
MTVPGTMLTVAEAAARCRTVLDQVDRVVVGKRDAVRLVLLGVLAGGHVLIEDLPGMGKTLIAKSLATALGLDFSRVQFTPDLLPADITGAVYLDQRNGDLAFRPGPVFANLVLADEINRATPKTQSALLEAMAERQVTVDGVSHQLPDPFVVLATDNPIEYEGTYPLPEAQLDRFMLRVRIGYLATDDEIALLHRHVQASAAPTPPAVEQVVTGPQVLSLRHTVDSVEAHPHVLAYIVAVLDATRQHRHIVVGASPRGGLALLQLARAAATLAGRDYVLPDDVKALAVSALAHRLVLKPEMWVREISAEQVLSEILTDVAVPGGPGDLQSDLQSDLRSDRRGDLGVAS